MSDVEKMYDDFCRRGIPVLPAAVLVLAEVIAGKRVEMSDGEVLSHNFFMALKELGKQGIAIPVSVSMESPE